MMVESAAQVAPKKGFPWLKVLMGTVLLCLLAIGILVWWILRPIQPVKLSDQEKIVLEEKLEAIKEPEYVKGTNEIILTEREINGLLHQNAAEQQTVRLEFATDAVHAYVDTLLPEDVPMVGGKRLKLRARFLVKHDENVSEMVLDDVTVWGISLPNEWLGEIKGKNLLKNAFGSENARLSGVDDFSVEPGRLRIRLAE